VPKAAAPPIATAGLAPATPIVPPNTEPLGPAPSATQTAPASPPVQVAAASRVVIAATAKTWFQLSENHKPIVTKMLAAGDSYSVPDRPGISLWTGNAGGIHLIVDGQSLPSLGRVGEIKRHIDLDPAALLATPVH
jgi:cytoskeleton protein RodZ